MPPMLPPSRSVGACSRIIATASALVLLVATNVRAQHRIDVGVGIRVVSATRTSPAFAPGLALGSGWSSAAPKDDEFMRYVGLGMALGALVGGAYGVYDAAHCDDCFPGLQPGIFVADLGAGILAGAAVGATTYVLSWPVRRLARR